MYDYREAMTEDVKQWITDEVTPSSSSNAAICLDSVG